MNRKALLARRIDAAMGRIPCDLVLKNVRFLDVFSCEWREGEIGIIDGTIVSLDSGLKAKRTRDGKGRHLVPGFIDAHVHVESSLLTPKNFQTVVLPKGTTTAICDPHELTNVQGVSALKFFLKEAEGLALDLRVMLSSCVPATHMETNGGGTLNASHLAPFMKHPKALGLAEMMNVPGVLFKDKKVIEKLDKFLGVPLDGHAPLVRGRELSAYAATGVSSCHESSQLDEAKEKLQKGMAVWIREGSVAKDLKTLIPMLTLATSPYLGFCTDDRNPLDIAHEGHIDHLVRSAIRSGVAPEVALRSASLSVASHYSLDKGFSRVGAIAPGYLADLILLDDLESLAIADVFKKGELISELELPSAALGKLKNSIRTKAPAEKDLEGVSGNVHVIGVEAGKILTGRSVRQSNAKGVARLSVLERYGKGSKPANGYVTGFGENFKGAIASSVGHDSHNLIVVGDNTKDMQTALSALIQSGGGFCVVQNGSVAASLPLPMGGLMTGESPKAIEKSLLNLRAASRASGCSLEEPFLQLAFLSLPVIPSLKLTDKGLVDVDKFQIIDVRAS